MNRLAVRSVTSHEENQPTSDPSRPGTACWERHWDCRSLHSNRGTHRRRERWRSSLCHYRSWCERSTQLRSACRTEAKSTRSGSGVAHRNNVSANLSNQISISKQMDMGRPVIALPRSANITQRCKLRRPQIPTTMCNCLSTIE